MSSTSSNAGRDARRRLVDEAREAFERLRDPARPRTARATGDGAVREAVLRALADGPATGYEVVRRLAGGAVAPTAGQVYPALQLLADEGLATAEEDSGRRRWSLTDAGAMAADRVAADGPAAPAASARGIDLARSVALLAQTAALAGQTGDGEAVARSVEAVDEARHRILSILARD